MPLRDQRSALVFAGGQFEKCTLDSLDVAAFDEIWCADGGLEYAQQSGLTPTVVVGDFDSALQQSLQQAMDAGVRLIRHPTDKNASDLELTLRELADGGFEWVTLLGASGGRTDHALFNWLLVLQRDWPFRLNIIDATISATLVHADAPFDAPLVEGTVVSLLARESVCGVTTHGLKYALSNAHLTGGSTLGLSNEAIGLDTVSVSVDSGRLLVCVVHSSSPSGATLRNVRG